MVVKLFYALIGLIGLLLLYAGCFLTETEEGKLRNLLEELWIRVDDLQSTAMSRQAALLQQVFCLTARGLVTVFGQKLFSVKSLASCLCFALASMSLSLALLAGDSPAFPRTATIIWAIVFAVFGFSRRLRYLGLGLTALGAILSLLSLGGVFRAYQLSYQDVMSGILGYTLGMLSVIASIALIRWSLRLASQQSNAVVLVTIIVANLLLAAFLIGPLLFALLIPRLFWLGPKMLGILQSRPMVFLYSTSGTTLFAAVLALIVVIVLLSALVHRMLWPALSRTVYAAHRHGLIEPKLLRKVGVACLILAWPNNFLVRAIANALHFGG